MSTQPTPAETTHPNPAVARCLHEYTKTYKAQYAVEQCSYTASGRAAAAFRQAMPLLDGPANIRDFIACVAQGVLLDAIEERQSSKLLYAAQVALSAIRSSQANPKPANPA
jgi:hypothetical protein